MTVHADVTRALTDLPDPVLTDSVHAALGRVTTQGDLLRNRAAWEGVVAYEDAVKLAALAQHLAVVVDGAELVSITSGAPT